MTAGTTGRVLVPCCPIGSWLEWIRLGGVKELSQCGRKRPSDSSMPARVDYLGICQPL